MDKIGQTFERSNNTLIIVDKIKAKKWTYNYILECSVCSKDKELWPRGSIKAPNYSSLVKGITPCGCAKGPKFKEWQVIILINRVCSDVGFEFKGFKGKYIGMKTKIILHNPSTGNTWDSKIVFDLLYRSQEDPSISRSKPKLKLDDMVSKIPEGKYICFETYGLNYNFKCTTCSNDEYATNKVGSDVFPLSTTNIYRGVYVCRCNNSYIWNQKEREYQIDKRLIDLRGLFLGWVNGCYRKSSDKFNWKCKCSYLNKQDVNSFINGEVGCYNCNVLGNKFKGYYPDKLEDEDFLYVILFDDKTLKVGRTFNLKQRLGNLVSESHIKHITYYKTYTESHNLVWNTEQDIHKRLTKLGYHVPKDWSGEIFDISCLHIIEKWLDVDYDLKPN